MASPHDHSVPKEFSKLSLDSEESEVQIVSKGSPCEHKHAHREHSRRRHRHNCTRQEDDNDDDCGCRESPRCAPQQEQYMNQGLIQFSSGVPLPLIEYDGNVPITPITPIPILPNGLNSDFPVLLGFGSATFAPTAPSFISPFVLTDPVTGQFTVPAGTIIAGGFSFPIPFRGRIRNLEVSSDIRTIPLALPEAPAVLPSLNTLGLQFDFTVFVSNSSPNNGIDHATSPYLLSTLSSSLRFGAPTNTNLLNDTTRSATNLNTGSIIVNPGDRIGVRVRTNSATNASALELAFAVFSASLQYERLVCA
jgi:hypothetical protein